MSNPNNYDLAMNRPESSEVDDQSAETFMPLEHMKDMTAAALIESERIDDEGVVQPIEVKRNLHGSKWLRGPATDSLWRSDMFVPTEEELRPYIEIDEQGLETRNRIADPSMDTALYRALTGQEKVDLSPDQATGVLHDNMALETTLAARPDYTLSFSEEQKEDAHHVTANVEAEPEFAPLRVYVPAGLDAVKVAESVFAAGADMSYAKIWTPRAAVGEQTIRQDTPIFEVTTFNQLTSLLASLHRLAEAGQLPSQAAPVAGQEIDGLPGVYMGQTEHGKSFNGRMRDLFGKPIQEACSQVKLAAGDVVDERTLSAIAENARTLARRHADEMGANPHNHAFLRDQPVDEIIAIVKRFHTS